MALFDGLLGGGSADPYDLYGDILTAKQREALRARSSDQTWANAANFLAKAAMPTNKKIPLGGLLAGLAGAMGGSNQDEAALTALKGGEITAKIAKLRREQRLLDELDPIQKEFLRRRMAQYGYASGGGAPTAPTVELPSIQTLPPPAPAGPVPPGTPPLPSWSSSVPTQDLSALGLPVRPRGGPLAAAYSGESAAPLPIPPAPPGGRVTPADYGVPGPGAGLLGGPAEGIDALGGGNDIWTALAALTGGGGGGSGAPFDMASLGQGQGLPDLGPVQVEALSGKAAPAGAFDYGVDYLQKTFGLEPHQARGAVKWMQNVESGLDPSIVNPKSGAFGVAQHLGPRKDKLLGQYGPQPSFEQQFSFIGDELRGPEAKALSSLKSARTEDEAYRVWGRDFERPSAAEYARATGLPNVGRVRIEPLGGAAAPAGGGLIPGLGVAPEELAILNSMYEAAGVDAPFKSLLDTYYKSPGYLEEKTRVETQARKDVEAKEDPLIEAQKTRQRLLVEEEIKPRLEAAIEKAKSPVLQEREAALAVIARETKRLEIAGQAAVSIQDIDIIGDDGKTSSTKLPALEIARRNADAAGRRALGDLTPRPGDIATRPVLSPEETARQTQRGKTQEETREVDVWTPAGPVKQTLTNAEIDRRRASRAAGGAPQVGDIIDKPVMTPADTKISESFGERFIKMRDRAEAAEETITDTHNLRRKLDSGIFTGLDANFNLFMSKLGDTVGYKNLAEPDKIRNTEVFVAGIAKDVLAMAKELKPVSNTDLVFLDRMAGGVNMSAGAIRELLDMRERYARLAITRHNAEAGRKHPDTFKGTRQYIDMPPDYQIQESTTPSGNRVIINR